MPAAFSFQVGYAAGCFKKGLRVLWSVPPFIRFRLSDGFAFLVLSVVEPIIGQGLFYVKISEMFQSSKTIFKY